MKAAGSENEHFYLPGKIVQQMKFPPGGSSPCIIAVIEAYNKDLILDYIDR